MYAKVIVDVPAKQTNRPFDYAVPASLVPWVEIGSRVGVPFGPRVIQGFVVGLSAKTDLPDRKVKPIEQVLDVLPPLTPELVELARWISGKYLCHEITALQAMIPGALKAKYERVVSVNEEAAGAGSLVESQEAADVLDYIRGKGSVLLEQLLIRYPAESMRIKEWIRDGTLAEEQTIKNRLSKKKALTLFPADKPEDMQALLDSLSAGARRQREVVEYMIRFAAPIRLSDLMLKLDVGAGTVKSLAEKGPLSLREVEVQRDPYADRNFPRTVPLPLTEEQRQVFQPVKEALDALQHRVFLLHGVTGSGKTEIYLQAIRKCLDEGREAIVLVPEISLTPQMVERFKGRFGSEVAVLHSRLSQGERYDEWRKISAKKVRVVIGARSAVFAPFTKLGLIIIDEEHETSYKQEDSPKYHAREVAIERARKHDASVILGSATPSLESYYHAVKGGLETAEGPLYRLLTMEHRVENRPMPPVRIVDMREELNGGNRSMFSRALYRALEERLARKEQSVLLLNRRGYSTFVMCRTCGHTLGCPHCDISLTYHQSSRRVRCHYCGYSEREPEECPKCASAHIRYFGTGTQRVEEELGRLFPGIRVIRMDVDTTSEKGSHEKWLNLFRDQKADVLLGTQMVAKGLDFPNVTLVGVIAADTVLNLPDFRAAERTFQLLTQVAGRAGRHQLPGEVFVQTYAPEHYSVVSASHHDYDSFMRTELDIRANCGYPPYFHLILITLSHEQVPLLVRASQDLAARLKQIGKQSGIPLSGSVSAAETVPAMEVLGPVASPIPRIKDRYRFRCMVKYRGDFDISALVAQAVSAFDDLCRQENLQISVDVDPQLLM